MSPNLLKEDFRNLTKVPIPHYVKPMLTTLVANPFSKKGWLFEIKWDGYRAIAEIKDRNVRLYSRNEKSFNEQYPQIVENLKKIKNDVVLDGEIVVLDKDGKPNFQMLQNYSATKEGLLTYFIFDILYLNGYDLSPLSLIKRKEILKNILPPIPNIKYGDYIEEKGEQFYNLISKKNIEGIIAKNMESPYRQGQRTMDWQKIKVENRQEAIICGFTEPRGGRKYFGSLILGAYKNNHLVYIGHAGTGFSEQSLSDLKKRFDALTREASPFSEIPKTKAKWIEPKLVCEVKFAEWTKGGVMRQPVFMGLREDKDPKSVKLEMPQKIKNEKVK